MLSKSQNNLLIQPWKWLETCTRHGSKEKKRRQKKKRRWYFYEQNACRREGGINRMHADGKVVLTECMPTGRWYERREGGINRMHADGNSLDVGEDHSFTFKGDGGCRGYYAGAFFSLDHRKDQ